MKFSAKQWIRWLTPLRTHCKRSLLLVMLGLFASVHLMASSPTDNNFAETSITTANWNTAAGNNLDATIESGESSVSMDVALRDASHQQQPHLKSRFSSAEMMSGSRRFTQPGTTGPPSILNNTSAAA